MYQRRLTWHTDEEITGTEVDLTMGVTEGLDHVLDGVLGFLTEVATVVRVVGFTTLVAVSSGCTTVESETRTCLVFTDEIDKLTKEQGKTLWEYYRSLIDDQTLQIRN